MTVPSMDMDFNGGRGALANRPRDSIPLENFLIGDTCLETAEQFCSTCKQNN